LTLSRPSSHGIGGDSAGSRSGYRPDPKTAEINFMSFILALTFVTKRMTAFEPENRADKRPETNKTLFNVG